MTATDAIRGSSTSTDTAPLEVRGLSVAYDVVRGDESDAALLDANATAFAGRMTAIVGPNGAGKSTLLHAALGLVPKLGGTALFWGQPFAHVRRRVAFLPQRESIDWDFPITALDVATMGATSGAGWWIPAFLRRWFGAGHETDRARAALERVGMQDFVRRPIGDLSGGQQQRVFLARALAQGADMVLLDEPFAGVDATTEAILLDELRALTAEGRTVVCVHHDLETVEERFDDVILVNRTVVRQGPANEVLASEDFRRVFGDRV